MRTMIIIWGVLAVASFTVHDAKAVPFFGTFTGEITAHSAPPGFDTSSAGVLGFVDREANVGVMGTFSYDDDPAAGAPGDGAAAPTWGFYESLSSDPWLRFSIWTVSAQGTGPVFEFGYTYEQNVQEVSVRDQHFDPNADVFSVWGESKTVDVADGSIVGDQRDAFFLEIEAPAEGSVGDMINGDGLAQTFTWNRAQTGGSSVGYVRYANQRLSFSLASVSLAGEVSEEPPSSVPEPSTLLLLGSGLLGLCRVSRKM